MSAPPPVLAWLDLEMTGLEPADCVIVEMALIVTDANLTPLAPPLEMVIWQPESALATMSPFVRRMHEKSGLLAKISKSEHALADAEQQALKLLSAHAPYRTARLCGNSIAQDRRFLFKYMPSFENYLHYRQVDVSTIKELALWWNDMKFSKADGGQHTALFDIQQSLAELKWYREHFLRRKS
jgi:oligoribonuclease